MNALSQLSRLPGSKDEVKSFVAVAKQELLSGEVDVMKFYAQAAYLLKAIESLADDPDVKDVLKAEVEKYGKETTYGNVQFKISERRTFDFSEDTYIQALEARKKEISAAIKEREQFLKSIKSPIADMETGELLYPAPAKVQTIISKTIL